MAKVCFPWFDTRFFDANGDPLAAGYIEVYNAGTDVHATTYNEAGAENAWPIVLEDDGSCQLRGLESYAYDLMIYSAADVLIRSVENVVLPSAGAAPTSATYDYIQFNTTATPVASVEGLLQWNQLEHCLDVGLFGGSIGQIPFEELTIVWNNTGSTIANGTPVYCNGTSGQRISVAPIGAASANAYRFFGLATQDIATNSLGVVARGGRVRDLNTNAWNEGDSVWLSATTGQLTNSAPAKPNHQVRVGTVEKKSGGAGIILLDIVYFPELGELSNVSLSGITNGQGLQWNGSTQLFERGGPWLPLAGNNPVTNPMTGSVFTTGAFYAGLPTQSEWTLLGPNGIHVNSINGQANVNVGALNCAKIIGDDNTGVYIAVDDNLDAKIYGLKYVDGLSYDYSLLIPFDRPGSIDTISSREWSDDRYLKLTGGTVSGTILVTGNYGFVARPSFAEIPDSSALGLIGIAVQDNTHISNLVIGRLDADGGKYGGLDVTAGGYSATLRIYPSQFMSKFGTGVEANSFNARFGGSPGSENGYVGASPVGGNFFASALGYDRPTSGDNYVGYLQFAELDKTTLARTAWVGLKKKLGEDAIRTSSSMYANAFKSEGFLFTLGKGTDDGDWRLTTSAGNLIFQKRESGVWVTKTTIEA